MQAEYIRYGIIAAAAVALAWVARRAADAGKTLAAAAADAVAAIPGAVNEAAGSAIQSAGEVVGIPRTDESRCDAAIREGRLFDASLYCPAARFLTEGIGGALGVGSAKAGAAGTGVTGGTAGGNTPYAGEPWAIQGAGNII